MPPGVPPFGSWLTQNGLNWGAQNPVSTLPSAPADAAQPQPGRAGYPASAPQLFLVPTLSHPG